MNLSEYFISEGGTGTALCPVIARIARAAACSPETLYMISKGHKNASFKLAKRLAAATRDTVTKYDIRPDIYGEASATKQKARAA